MAEFDPTDPLPPTTDTVDQWTLPATFQYPGRKVARGSPALIGGPEGIVAEDFQSLSRIPGGMNPGDPVYVGKRLVNGNGEIERGPYSVREAYGQLASKGRGDRIAFTNELYERGLYNGSKPTATRLGTADINAMENYLLTMNRYGVTADVGLGLFRQEFPVGGYGTPGSGGGQRRVTNAEDLKMVFKKSAADLLGHSLSAQDEAKFARLYQQMEMGGDAPTAGTAASNQIQKQFGGQVQSYKAGGLAEIMDQMIGRLGS